MLSPVCAPSKPRSDGRRTYPKEVVGLGIKGYRQTFFKPYRVIYRVIGSQVIIYLIADGRRDMQSCVGEKAAGRIGHLPVLATIHEALNQCSPVRRAGFSGDNHTPPIMKPPTVLGWGFFLPTHASSHVLVRILENACGLRSPPELTVQGHISL